MMSTNYAYVDTLVTIVQFEPIDPIVGIYTIKEFYRPRYSLD